jgi:hypothetical protein
MGDSSPDKRAQSEYERSLDRQRRIVDSVFAARRMEGGASEEAESEREPEPEAPTTGIERAKQFLYDEDELTSTSTPRNTYLGPRHLGGGEIDVDDGLGPGGTAAIGLHRMPRTLSSDYNMHDASAQTGEEYDKYISHKNRRRGRRNPVSAVFMGGLHTCRLYGKKRVVRLTGGVAFLILLFLIGLLISGGGEKVNHKRVYAIGNRITTASITEASQLSTVGTAQYHALHWLANTDPAQLKTDDEYLLQRYALAVLFYSDSGSIDHIAPVSRWKSQDGWMTKKGICMWFGVTCTPRSDSDNVDEVRYDGDAAVMSLNLTNNALEGTIPSEMAGLTSLLLLDLSKNSVTGTLPSQLAQMSTLTDLFLRENKLVGTIPTDFGNFASMRLLHLGQNQLNGNIPNTLKHIVNLKALALDKNQLSGSIPDLAELSKLGEFELDEDDDGRVYRQLLVPEYVLSTAFTHQAACLLFTFCKQQSCIWTKTK